MTTPTNTTDVNEVDGSDEADHDAQEEALGLALGALFLSSLLPGPSSFFNTLKSWDDQIEAAIGPILQAFMQRSALDIAAEVDQPGSSVTALTQAAETYPQVLAWVQGQSHQTLQNLTDSHVSDTDTAQAALSAAEGLARGTAVYAKSEVREQTVGKLGAVYKTWRTRHDAKVRVTHHELEGDTIPYDSIFHVDGMSIKYPGDPEADISLTANCRCHLNYRLRPLENVYGESLVSASVLREAEHGFDEALHPRGADGKFIQKGDHVIINDGQGHKAEGVVEGFQEDGTQVRLNSGRLIAVPHTYISQAPTAEASLAPRKSTSTLTAEQRLALEPSRGGWTTVRRAKTVAALKSTPEGNKLLKTVDSFQSGGSTTIPRLRTDIEKHLSLSQSDLTEGRKDSVENLLHAISNSDASHKSLYRGMTLPESLDAAKERYRPGSNVNLSLASFSADPKLAQSFSTASGGKRVKGATRTPVIMEWDDTGPKKALPLENLGKSRIFGNEREWLTSGTFQVVTSKTVKRGGVDTLVIKVKQVNTWR